MSDNSSINTVIDDEDHNHTYDVDAATNNSLERKNHTTVHYADDNAKIETLELAYTGSGTTNINIEQYLDDSDEDENLAVDQLVQNITADDQSQIDEDTVPDIDELDPIDYQYDNAYTNEKNILDDRPENIIDLYSEKSSHIESVINQQSDEEIENYINSIVNTETDTKNHHFNEEQSTEDHGEDSDDLDYIIQAIINDAHGKLTDLDTEEDIDDYIKSLTDPTTDNHNDIKDELTRFIEEHISDENNHDNNEVEDALCEIENLWEKLSTIWPLIQDHPQLRFKIEELWSELRNKKLEETGNTDYQYSLSEYDSEDSSLYKLEDFIIESHEEQTNVDIDESPDYLDNLNIYVSEPNDITTLIAQVETEDDKGLEHTATDTETSIDSTILNQQANETDLLIQRILSDETSTNGEVETSITDTSSNRTLEINSISEEIPLDTVTERYKEADDTILNPNNTQERKISIYEYKQTSTIVFLGAAVITISIIILLLMKTGAQSEYNNISDDNMTLHHSGIQEEFIPPITNIAQETSIHINKLTPGQQLAPEDKPAITVTMPVPHQEQDNDYRITTINNTADNEKLIYMHAKSDKDKQESPEHKHISLPERNDERVATNGTDKDRTAAERATYNSLLQADNHIDAIDENSNGVSNENIVRSNPGNGGKQTSWSLNLESIYEHKPPAEKAIRELRDKDINAEVKRVQVANKTWYRISISGFKTKQDAITYMQIVKENSHYKRYWISANKTN